MNWFESWPIRVISLPSEVLRGVQNESNNPLRSQTMYFICHARGLIPLLIQLNCHRCGFLLQTSVSSITGTSLGRSLRHAKPSYPSKRAHRPGVARANRNPDTIIEKTCQVGDHFLDSVSNYILRQIQRPIAKYIPHNWDPLYFLPVNLQSDFRKSEALVSIS